MAAIDLPVPTLLPLNRNAVGTAGVLGALALLGTLPFLWPIHYFPLPSLDSEIVAAWCLAFGLISSGLLVERDTLIRWPLPATLVGLSALALFHLQLGMLAYSQQAVRFLLYAACILVAYVFGRRLLSAGLARSAMVYFCAALLIGGLYTVFVQWLQLLNMERFPMWLAVVYRDEMIQTRPFGNLAQSNHCDTYLGLAALSSLHLAASTRRTWFVVPSLLVVACGLAMTGSRMGLAFLLVVAGALFAPTALRLANRRSSWFAVSALLGGYAVGLIAVRLVAGEYDTLVRMGQNTVPIRLELWRQAWAIAWQHPLVGIGVGQFVAAQYWLARDSANTFLATHCHNIILQFAAEFGWPAALGVCLLGLHWGLRDLRARLARPEAALAIGAMLLIGIHSMLEFPLWYLYFAIPAGLLFALGEPEVGLASSLKVRRILPVAGIAVVGVGIAYSVNYYWIVRASEPLWLEAKHIRQRTPMDALTVISTADSQLFPVEAQRLMVGLKHPPDENTDGPLQRAARVAEVVPVPEIITQYIVLLAKAGRIDEATRHAARLRVFGRDEYPMDRDWILDETRNLGPQTAPLRHLLREPLTVSSPAAQVAPHPN